MTQDPVRETSGAPRRWRRKSDITTPEAQADLLQDEFATGQTRYVANALGVVARARNMTQLARDAGVTREALYKALNDRGDLRLSTFLGVSKALGFEISVKSRPETEQMS